MIKTVLCSLLLSLSMSGASKLSFLYNCWLFESNTAGVNCQPLEIANPQFTAGLFGSALNCDGTLNSAGVAIGTGTFAVHQDFTAMVWFKSRTDSNNLVLLDCRGSSPNRGFTLYHAGNIDGTAQARLRVIDGFFSLNIYSANSVPTNQWNCVIFGYNATTQKHFVRLNDAQVDGAVFAVSATPLPNMAVGARSTHTDPAVFDGAIDLVALWKGKVLSAAEMSELYNLGAGINYPFP